MAEQEDQSSLAQPKGFFARLNKSQFGALIIMLLAVMILLISAVMFFTREELVPLYPYALDAKTITEVQEVFQGREIEIKVKGGKVFVPRSMRESMQIELEASDISPEGKSGFDLLADTNPLEAGQTMVEIRKRRALEIDLADTLEANPNIRRAQVLITPAIKSPFEDEREPAKATVMLNVKNRQQLGREQISAMQAQLAGAIEGAVPETIVITDQYHNLLSEPISKDSAVGLSQANLRIKHEMEQDLKRKAERAVETILGPGKVNAQVTLDIDFDQIQSENIQYGGADAEGERQLYVDESKTSRIYAPTEEGVAGVGANTPTVGNQGDTLELDTNGNPLKSLEEKKNLYTVDQLKTVTRHTPYKINRMTIGLNLDYKTTEFVEEGKEPSFLEKLTKTDPDWITVRREPLSDIEKTNIRQLVEGSTGFDSTRGDLITIQNFEFISPISMRAQAEMESGQLFEYIKRWTPWILQIIMFVVLLMIGVSMFRRFVAPILQQAQLEEPALSSMLPGGTPKTVAELESELEQEIEQAIPSAQLSKSEIMKKRIQEMSQEDPEAVASLVRTWMIEED